MTIAQERKIQKPHIVKNLSNVEKLCIFGLIILFISHLSMIATAYYLSKGIKTIQTFNIELVQVFGNLQKSHQQLHEEIKLLKSQLQKLNNKQVLYKKQSKEMIDEKSVITQLNRITMVDIKRKYPTIYYEYVPRLLADINSIRSKYQLPYLDQDLLDDKLIELFQYSKGLSTYCSEDNRYVGLYSIRYLAKFTNDYRSVKFIQMFSPITSTKVAFALLLDLLKQPQIRGNLDKAIDRFKFQYQPNDM